MPIYKWTDGNDKDFQRFYIKSDEKKEVFIENDVCGLFRGRQILPFEHLSRFQDDRIVKSL
jgi:hypothetical protein